MSKNNLDAHSEVFDDNKRPKAQLISTKKAKSNLENIGDENEEVKGSPQTPKQDESNVTEDEQKKGFLRSIFGYFRGSRRGHEQNATEA